MCTPVAGGECVPHTRNHRKTAPSAPACPFMKDTETDWPNWDSLALQPGCHEDGHNEDVHHCAACTALPCLAVSIPADGARTLLHWEPLLQSGVGAAPPAHPTGLHGQEGCKTILQRGEQGGMSFQRETPRSSFGKGASWEAGLC